LACRRHGSRATRHRGGWKWPTTTRARSTGRPSRRPSTGPAADWSLPRPTYGASSRGSGRGGFSGARTSNN
jgi:hypothetical protein